MYQTSGDNAVARTPVVGKHLSNLRRGLLAAFDRVNRSKGRDRDFRALLRGSARRA